MALPSCDCAAAVAMPSSRRKEVTLRRHDRDNLAVLVIRGVYKPGAPPLLGEIGLHSCSAMKHLLGALVRRRGAARSETHQ